MKPEGVVGNVRALRLKKKGVRVMEDTLEFIDLSKVEITEQVQESPDGFMLNKGAYFIEKSRCRTYYEILSWVLQLSGKVWVDRELILEFIEKACVEADLPRP